MRASSGSEQRRQRAAVPAQAALGSDADETTATPARQRVGSTATNQRRRDATRRNSPAVAAPATDERRRGCDAMNGAVARCRPVGCAISSKSRQRDGVKDVADISDAHGTRSYDNARLKLAPDIRFSPGFFSQNRRASRDDQFELKFHGGNEDFDRNWSFRTINLDIGDFEESDWGLVSGRRNAD
ncbi:hypothetical protein Scep_017771 [Stephania cephalantha]|uniref:Uncharacterized protein n=1 Tax=Stephania cephalantha TaxID=152367 RepID=A0AAP0NUJ4_9MAGN